MKKSLVIGIALMGLLLAMPLASAEHELKVTTKQNTAPPFYAEAGSKLILFARLLIDGESIQSCDVIEFGVTPDPCTDMKWGFMDPYTYEVPMNDCIIVPTSQGKLFQCNIDVPETPGETSVTFSHSSGGGKRKLIVYPPCNNGCLLEDDLTTCLPLGTRKEGGYCSIDNEFAEQKTDGEYCDNNWECRSNICTGDECVSLNLIQKIINFFKALFGIKSQVDEIVGDEIPEEEELPTNFESLSPEEQVEIIHMQNLEYFIAGDVISFTSAYCSVFSDTEEVSLVEMFEEYFSSERFDEIRGKSISELVDLDKKEVYMDSRRGQFGDRVEFTHMKGDIVAEFPSKEGSPYSSYEWSAIYRKENGLWKIITADFG